MKKLTPDKGALSEGAEELFFKTQGFVCLFKLISSCRLKFVNNLLNKNGSKYFLIYIPQAKIRLILESTIDGQMIALFKD